MTLEGVLGEWEADREYTLSFNVGSIELDSVVGAAQYNVRIYAINTNVFDDADRNNFDFNALGGGSAPGSTLLSTTSGSVTNTDLSTLVTIPYTTTTNFAYVGQDIAFAFVQTGGNPTLVDRVEFEAVPPAGTVIILY